MLCKPLPFLGLRRENEIRCVAPEEAESTVVVVWAALAEASCVFGAGIGAVLE